MTKPTISYLLSVTTLLAFCCAIVTSSGLDLINGSGKLTFVAITLGFPLCVHVLSTLGRIKTIWRCVLEVLVSALIATMLWTRQVNSGYYRITIGPEIIFIASLLEFAIGTAIVELGFILAAWYSSAKSHRRVQLQNGTEQRD